MIRAAALAALAVAVVIPLLGETRLVPSVAAGLAYVLPWAIVLVGGLRVGAPVGAALTASAFVLPFWGVAARLHGAPGDGAGVLVLVLLLGLVSALAALAAAPGRLGLLAPVLTLGVVAFALSVGPRIWPEALGRASESPRIVATDPDAPPPEVRRHRLRLSGPFGPGAEIGRAGAAPLVLDLGLDAGEARTLDAWLEVPGALPGAPPAEVRFSSGAGPGAGVQVLGLGDRPAGDNSALDRRVPASEPQPASLAALPRGGALRARLALLVLAGLAAFTAATLGRRSVAGAALGLGLGAAAGGAALLVPGTLVDASPAPPVVLHEGAAPEEGEDPVDWRTRIYAGVPFALPAELGHIARIEPLDPDRGLAWRLDADGTTWVTAPGEGPAGVRITIPRPDWRFRFVTPDVNTLGDLDPVWLREPSVAAHALQPWVRGAELPHAAAEDPPSGASSELPAGAPAWAFGPLRPAFPVVFGRLVEPLVGDLGLRRGSGAAEVPAEWVRVALPRDR